MDAEDGLPRPPDDPADRRAEPWTPRQWAALAGVLLALGVAGFFFARLRVASTWGFGAVCGNGVKEAKEECDDGNAVNEDGCVACKLAACGDGVKRTFVEECDDGNRLEGDGCSSGCLLCPTNETSFSSQGSGHCYWRETTPLPFSAAADFCRDKKGYLVTYAVDLEWREVTQNLFPAGRKQDGSAEGAGGAWIGLRQETRNGVRDFGWMSGERLLFSHWAIHEPRRAPGLDCAAQIENGAWAAVNCDQPRDFICERQRWSRAPTETRAYRRFVERKRWTEAGETCARNGGRLVTFRTIADQERIARRYPGPVWIGARFDPQSKQFVWEDGSALAYQDFAPGEPNLMDAQHCLALDIDGRWYNRECTDRYGFVCEVID